MAEGYDPGPLVPTLAKDCLYFGSGVGRFERSMERFQFRGAER